MTRIATLSDIHGNLPALEAVVADIEARGAPDGIWVLGDLAVFFPWPAETLARLRALPNVSFLRGNTDRLIATGVRPEMPVRSEKEWARMGRALAVRDANFQWTVERLSYADYQFLAALPAQIQTAVPGYGGVLAVHAAPGDDEARLYPHTPDGDVRPYLEGVDARLLLGGHTHYPSDRTIDGVRLINDGSAGLPFDGDNRPSYVLLDFENGTCRATLRRVAYDVEIVAAELDNVEHPMRQWLIPILRTGAPTS
jgi:predicted phosphodiesterase